MGICIQATIDGKNFKRRMSGAMRKKQIKPGRASNHGTYDEEFFQLQHQGSCRSAERILPLILKLIRCESAVDVGCGVGAWLRVLKELGVRDVVGLDGSYVNPQQLLISQQEFRAVDLTNPIHLDRRFDLVVSLEVAEHLPPNTADSFVASLVGLGPVVLFSAAIPYQFGTSHVNEQWPEYWAERFAHHGYFPVDCIRAHVWDDERVEAWYAQNTLVFASNQALQDHSALAEARAATGALARVHPKVYLTSVSIFRERLESATDPRSMSLRWTLRALPEVVRSAILRKI